MPSFSPTSVHDFNPRFPHGERQRIFYRGGRKRYFNPRFPHGERRHNRQRQKPVAAISTHASRTGSDFPDMTSVLAYEAFQPTLPARGATGMTDAAAVADGKISTHASRTGSDVYIWRYGRNLSAFQPTLPARGATKSDNFDNIDVGISTHAPRTGGDQRQRLVRHQRRRFQPTLPARGATRAYACAAAFWRAISTHAPRTGSDANGWTHAGYFKISTHAPRTGSDYLCVHQMDSMRNFNPRSPHGERPRR